MMDHLPPHPINHLPISVPLYSSLEATLEPGDFHKYSVLIPLDTLGSLTRPLSPQSEALLRTWIPHIQAWLYFAFLSATLQLRVPVSDFADETDANPSRGIVGTLHTHKLREYLRRWRDDHEAATHDQQRLAARREQTLAALQGAWTAVRRFADPAAVMSGEPALLAFRILGHTLQHAVATTSANSRGQAHEFWIDHEDVP